MEHTQHDQVRDAGLQVEREHRQDPKWHDDTAKEPFYEQVTNPQSTVPEPPQEGVPLSGSESANKGDETGRINRDIGHGLTGQTAHGGRKKAHPDATSYF